MTVQNSGVLTPNKPLTQEAIDEAKRILGAEKGSGIFVNQDMIDFEDSHGSCLNEDLDKLIQRFAELGFTLDGSITYYGDYEGTYIVEPGKMTQDVDKDKAVIRNASDDELLEELRRRGVRV